ncbi:hypothetical protein BST85_04915 [Aureitalea marina]|uniref:DUF3822 domain-containing protein n=1 Tax=Aureitalea marina TaxID=930804 RepID=A0A2S7KNX9_9FLAO|nr:hypothetical protein BST85_04915 [Aureitalea marina]
MSVQVSLSGLSFLVADASNRKAIGRWEHAFDSELTPEQVADELMRQFDLRPILEGPFEEIKVIHCSELYSIVPSSLFDSRRASDYLKFNARILAGDYLAHDEVSNTDLVSVYVPWVNINNLLFDKYGTFDYYHSVSLMLGYFCYLERAQERTVAYVHSNRNRFDLMIFKGGKLQLCNTYPFRSSEDFVYFLLFALEQLDYSPENIPVVLCGDIEQDDERWELLYTYIRELSFLERDLLNAVDDFPGPTHHQILLKLSL